MKLRNSPYEELVKGKCMNLFESVLKEVADQEWELRISLAKGGKPRATGYSTKEDFITSNEERLSRKAQTLIDLMQYSDDKVVLP
jgi:hypothetical protein